MACNCACSEVNDAAKLATRGGQYGLESLALSLITPPNFPGGAIAADRFVAPSLGRKCPTGRCTAAGSVGRGVLRPGSKHYRAAQSDSLPYPAAARFLLGSCPACVFDVRGLASQSSLRILAPPRCRRRLRGPLATNPHSTSCIRTAS